jgi:multicomponent K+:H+ antiporter subunit F
MSPLLTVAIDVALGMLVLAMLCALYRLLRGPAAQDRLLALDTLTVNAMLVILALGLRWRSSMYFEAAVLVSLLGFVASTAMAKFLLRGEVIE